MPIIKLKSNSIASATPLVGDLILGELAVNTFDGIVYYKKDNGTESIVKLINSQDIDTDVNLNANSDVKIPSQKAIKTYVNGVRDVLDHSASAILAHDTDAVITPIGGNNFSISAGEGYLINTNDVLVKITWNTINTNATLAGDNFVNIDQNGNVTITSTFSISTDKIPIGYVRTNPNNTAIIGYSNARMISENQYARLGELFRHSIGVIVQEGLSTSMQATPNDLKITISQGYLWSNLVRKFINSTSTFTKLYDTSDYSYIVDSSTTANTVNTTFWNDHTQPAASALVTMTDNYYKKDLIFINPEGNAFYVYATAEYPSLEEAKAAPIPLVPDNIKLGIARSAAIITQKNATTISEILDVRPIIYRIFDTGLAASNATVISHDDLIDLLNDSHTQYHNDARGDLRYYTKSILDGGQLNNIYYTETEIDNLLSNKVTSANNVGTGSGTIFRDKTTVNLNFKSIKSGSTNTITITNNADDVTLDVPSSYSPFNKNTGFFEDFINNATITPYMISTVATGTNTVATIPTFGGTDQRIGILLQSTGASATGTAFLTGGGTTSLINLGNLAIGNSVTVAANIRIPTLSVAVQRFIYFFGLGDQNGATESTDGAYFKYTDNLSAGQFEFVTANNSTRVATASGITVAAGTQYNLKVIVTNILGTLTAFWYINGNQVGTTTTGLPITTGRDLTIFTGIQKTVGTTARTVEVDWVYLNYETNRSINI